MENTKLEKANELKIDIEKLNDFIDLITKGQLFDKRYNGQNKFSEIELSAYLWTGTDNPRYMERLNNNKDIKEFVNAGLKRIEEIRDKKKEEFENIFK